MDTARLRFTTIAVALGLLAACASGFDPNNPQLNHAHLEIVGSPAVNLRYGAMAELTVRYVTDSGDTIANAPIEYEFVGVATGCQLSALQTTTNGQGEASIGLTSGNTDAMFAVKVTPPKGDAVNFNVAVSQTDAGSIVVSMTYPGTRDLVRFDTYLFQGQTCIGMDARHLPTAMRQAPAESTVSAHPAFAGVPVGNGYTVAVTAQASSDLAAFGCADNVAVTSGADTPVNVTLHDLQLLPSFAGVWDLDNHFDFAGTLPPSVGAVIDILAELTDDSCVDSSGNPCAERYGDTDGDGITPEFGADPGAFITDLAMRQTCAWACDQGTTYDTCSPGHPIGDISDIYLYSFSSWSPSPGSPGAIGRFSGGCALWDIAVGPAQTEINDIVASVVPSFVTDWLDLAGDLSRAINQAHILSVLTISPPTGSDRTAPMTHELVQMVVDLRDPTSTPPGMTREFTFALADAGLTSVSAMDQVTMDGTTLTIPMHTFQLNFGQLVLYIYRNIFLNRIFGYMDTGDMLTHIIDCTSVANTVVANVCSCDPMTPGDCSGCVLSPSTATTYCNTALNAAGTLIEGALTSALDVNGTLTIHGSATGAGIDPATAQVNQLQNGMWSGQWAESMTMDNITGTFTGTRRAM